MADSNEEYEKVEYWDKRYTTEEEYEWLGSYEPYAEIMRKYLSKDSKMLMLGCGNSRLSADIFDDGFENMVNLDYSQVVIDKMAEKNAGRKGMTWVVGDMLNMEFEDESFDCLIDKGTMEAVLTNPDPDVSLKSVDAMLHEASRVLKPGGVYILICFGKSKLPLLNKEKYGSRFGYWWNDDDGLDHCYGWDRVDRYTVALSFGFDVFCCVKNGPLPGHYPEATDT
eukprot:TRINITY_DN6288_c0_g1_i1.p1 TRINITY_DN6288_c0_g1~~TRINITY_DN6288_c0_g1_i1.p1  ORF type:complete len:225 (+),score=53.70 TRINITY_DN6288_c0_g1_i1:122-796(+)